MKKSILALAVLAAAAFSAQAHDIVTSYVPAGSVSLGATSSVTGGTSSQSVQNGVGVSQHGASATSQNTSWATAAQTPGVNQATVSANTGTNGTTTTSSYGSGVGYGDAFANQSGAAAAAATAGAYKSAGTTLNLGPISIPLTSPGAQVGSVAATSGVSTQTGSNATVVGTGDVKTGTSGQATNGSWASVSGSLGNTVVSNAIGASNDFNKVDAFVNYANGGVTRSDVGGTAASQGAYAGAVGVSK